MSIVSTYYLTDFISLPWKQVVNIFGILPTKLSLTNTKYLLSIRNIIMDYTIMLNLQKWLYINVYLYIIWVVANSYFLFIKVLKLEHLSRYLSITVFMLLTVIEFIRLYLGHYGNLSCRVPELAGFLMLTILMQMPLVSFFLFNPYLLSTPTEFVLHASLWMITIAEIVYCFLALKQASSVAKSMYISRSRDLGRLK